MKQTCVESGQEFEVDEQDLAFYDKISPVFAGEKYLIPPPTLSPRFRLKRRLAFSNQIYVYHRKCSWSGRLIYSMFPEDAPFPVIENDTWWGDSWDAVSYGRDYDFSRTFFEQYEELRNEVPHFARSVLRVENSDYTNNASDIKNCYLIFNTSNAEDCMYCESVWNSRDCVDCTFSPFSELCYDCLMCTRCYNVQSSQISEDCQDSYFLLNCRSCSHCFGCVNLRHASYCIFNQEYSKQEYEATLASFEIHTHTGRTQAAEECRSFWQEHPRPHAVTLHTEDVTGNYISEARDVQDSFLISQCENLRYCFNLRDGIKDCYDYSSFGRKAELVYESCRCGIDFYRCLFCFTSYSVCSDLYYCMLCVSSKDCFGCVGVRNKQHCIFNKQYTKAEYESLVPQVIRHMETTGEWGEFFPLNLSPSPYNHSFAQRYFPLSREESLRQGLDWFDEPKVKSEAISAEALPDQLPETDEPFTVRSAEKNKKKKHIDHKIRDDIKETKKDISKQEEKIERTKKKIGKHKKPPKKLIRRLIKELERLRKLKERLKKLLAKRLARTQLMEVGMFAGNALKMTEDEMVDYLDDYFEGFDEYIKDLEDRIKELKKRINEKGMKDYIERLEQMLEWAKNKWEERKKKDEPEEQEDENDSDENEDDDPEKDDDLPPPNDLTGYDPENPILISVGSSTEQEITHLGGILYLRFVNLIMTTTYVMHVIVFNYSLDTNYEMMVEVPFGPVDIQLPLEGSEGLVMITNAEL